MHAIYSRHLTRSVWLSLEAVGESLGIRKGKENRLLCTRSKNKTLYYIPGGKIKSYETKKTALIREIKEELNVNLIASTIREIGIFEGAAEGYPIGVLVRLHCYSAAYKGKLSPSSEINELVWLGYNDIELVAVADRLIFEFLKKKNLLF